MKRTADTKQRDMRWSLGCTHLELVASQLARPVCLINRFASRGSAVV